MSSPLTVSQMHQLNKLLNQSDPASLNKIGAIVKEGRWSYYVLASIDPKNVRVLAVTKLFMAALANLEEKGVKLFSPAMQSQAITYQKQFVPYIRLAGTLQKMIQHERVLHRLEIQLIALRYRIGSINGGLDKLTQADSEAFERLTTKALKWKGAQRLASDKTQLNKLEIEQLQEAAKYKEWEPLVGQQEEYDKEFFNWILRDYNRVDIFIEWPNTQMQIKKAFLSGMLGRIRRPGQNELLDIHVVDTKVQGIKKRILTLPVYHGPYNSFIPQKQEKINILKISKEVHFEQGDSTLAIKEIWKECAAKNWRESKINLCAWGLINLHPVLGVWKDETHEYDKFKMTQDSWTHQIPPVEILTHDEVKARFGVQVDNCGLFVKITVKRLIPGVVALECHSSTEIYEKLGKDQWKVMVVGAFADRYAQGLMDKFWLFCATLPLVWSVLDQNAGLSVRQEAGFVIMPESQPKEKELYNWFYDLMLKPGVFQFSAQNCSYPLQESINKIVTIPNLFRMPVTQARSGVKPFDRLLAVLDNLPDKLKPWGVWLLGISLLGHRRLEISTGEQHSVLSHFSKTIDIWNPAFLAHQIQEAKKSQKGPFAQGEIFWGNTERHLLYKEKKD